MTYLQSLGATLPSANRNSHIRLPRVGMKTSISQLHDPGAGLSQLESVLANEHHQSASPIIITKQVVRQVGR
jgi:hypothetical protein